MFNFKNSNYETFKLFKSVYLRLYSTFYDYFISLSQLLNYNNYKPFSIMKKTNKPFWELNLNPITMLRDYDKDTIQKRLETLENERIKKRWNKR